MEYQISYLLHYIEILVFTFKWIQIIETNCCFDPSRNLGHNWPWSACTLYCFERCLAQAYKYNYIGGLISFILLHLYIVICYVHIRPMKLPHIDLHIYYGRGSYPKTASYIHYITYVIM